VPHEKSVGSQNRRISKQIPSTAPSNTHDRGATPISLRANFPRSLVDRRRQRCNSLFPTGNLLARPYQPWNTHARGATPISLRTNFPRNRVDRRQQGCDSLFPTSELLAGPCRPWKQGHDRGATRFSSQALSSLGRVSNTRQGCDTNFQPGRAWKQLLSFLLPFSFFSQCFLCPLRGLSSFAHSGRSGSSTSSVWWTVPVW
jgi:hypothetical protein